MSQSILKMLYGYLTDTECGIQVKSKILKTTTFPTSDAQLLGQWFEYIATGQLPVSGIEPIPKTTRSGDLTAPFKRVEGHVSNYKAILSKYNIEVLETGKVLETDNYIGTIDILAKIDGKLSIIDIKTTGLLHDKWNDYGWHEERLTERENHMTQVYQYKYLAQEVLKEDVDFYFFVFNTANEHDAKIFKMVIDEFRIEQHELDLEKFYSYLNTKFLKLTDKELAKPELKRCSECPVDCKFRTSVPLITEIQH